MDSNSKATIEDDGPTVYGYHILAFLDLMGQKRHLTDIEGIIPSLFKDPNAEQTLIKTLQKTVGTINAFRTSFTSFFEAFINHGLPPGLPRDFEEKMRQLTKQTEINFQNFSDSQIFWTAISGKTELGLANSLNTLHVMLLSIAQITPLYLSKSIPFRGGIDIEGGICINSKSSELYGPVLNRAYQLECSRAQYPRVIIGKGILEFLDFVESQKFLDPILQTYITHKVLDCRRLIVIDEDGEFMVHFLSPLASVEYDESIDDEVASLDLVQGTEDFVKKCVNEYRDDPKLGPRYRKLQSYIDKYIGPRRRSSVAQKTGTTIEFKMTAPMSSGKT